MIEQSYGRVRVGRQEFRAGYPDSSLSERSGLIMFSFVWHGWDLLGSWLRETQSRVKKQGSRRASTREGRPPPPQTLENRIEWGRTRAPQHRFDFCRDVPLLLVVGKNRRDGLARSQQFIRIFGQWISFHHHFRLLLGS